MLKPTNISLQIPSELDRFFERLAKRRMTSKSAVIREILKAHVDATKAAKN